MNPLEQVLSQLRDAQMPSAPSLWPPAVGWWIIAILILVGIIYLLWYAMPWLRSLRYRRMAINTLQKMRDDTKEDAYMLAQINIILRRLAQAAYPDQRPATLTDKAWLVFLDQCANMRGFSQGDGKVLAHEPYRRNPQVRMDAVHRLALEWIRRHRTRRDSYRRIT